MRRVDRAVIGKAREPRLFDRHRAVVRRCQQRADADAESERHPARHDTAARAIATLLRASTSALWRVLGALLALPFVLGVAEPVYRWIAANRARMPGGTATCALPQAERERVG